MIAAATDTSWSQWLYEWAEIDGTWELFVIAFGLLAQTTFFLRWIVQWFSSERRGESHIPVAFWWLSLSGASMLFVYFAIRGEPVGMLGQSVGWVVYSRNLVLIKRNSDAP